MPIVWIEDALSRIARGEAHSVTSEGLRVRLADAPGFAPGDEVTLRVSFERGAPTIATTGSVRLVERGAGGIEVGLVWSAPKGARRELDAWLARAA